MKDYRIKVAFNDGTTVSFLVHADSFMKAVKVAVSSYPASLQFRIVSLHCEDVSI